MSAPTVNDVLRVFKEIESLSSDQESLVDPVGEAVEDDESLLQVLEVIDLVKFAIFGGPERKEGEGDALSDDGLINPTHLDYLDAESYNRFNQVISEVRECFRSEAVASIDSARELVNRFAGLPVRFNVFEALALQQSEAAYQSMLAWLLTPGESHGVGDSFFRYFLALIGISDRGRIFEFNRPLSAVVMEEVSWDVPTDEDFAPLGAGAMSAKSYRLRVDILVILPGTVIPIELKVKATESLYRFRKMKWNQTALYAEMFRSMLQAKKEGNIALSEVKDVANSLTGWSRSLRQVLDSTPSPSVSEAYLNQGNARILPVLIHPRNSCVVRSQRIGEREGEHGWPVRHVRWLDVQYVVERLIQEQDFEGPQRNILQSFRSTILGSAAEDSLLQVVEDLRLRVSDRRLIERFPVEYTLRLEEANNAINCVDECSR